MNVTKRLHIITECLTALHCDWPLHNISQ